MVPGLILRDLFYFYIFLQQNNRKTQWENVARASSRGDLYTNKDFILHFAAVGLCHALHRRHCASLDKDKVHRNSRRTKIIVRYSVLITNILGVECIMQHGTFYFIFTHTPMTCCEVCGWGGTDIISKFHKPLMSPSEQVTQLAHTQKSMLVLRTGWHTEKNVIIKNYIDQ